MATPHSAAPPAGVDARGAAGPRRRSSARAAAAVALFWAVVASLALGVGPRCAVATLFGVPCPTCGVSRALALALEGRFGASLRMHPLAVPAAAALAFVVGATVRAAWIEGTSAGASGGAGPRAPSRLVAVAAAVAAAVYVAMIALWVARGFGALGGPVPVR